MANPGDERQQIDYTNAATSVSGVPRQVEPELIEVEGEVAFRADGKVGPKQVKARLRHYGYDKFLLWNRGFHWINQTGYQTYGLRTEPAPKIPPPKRP
jgi:hypothetical protein